MRIAYFDCFSGVSGNMILGALLSAGLPQSDLEADLQALHLPGWQLQVRQDIRKSVSGTHVEVVQTIHEHAHRHIQDIEAIINASELPIPVKDKIMEVFTCIAQAEGRIHGIPDTEVHFHEVGAIDSIVDVAGGVAGLFRMKLDAVWASSIHLGSGFVEVAHGRMPVPAPATMEILRGVPAYSSDVVGELATPTGAALLRTMATKYGPWPDMQVEQIGYGLGTKDFTIPNVLRLAIGTINDSDQTMQQRKMPLGAAPAVSCNGMQQSGMEQLVVLETNLDDMNLELCQPVISMLLEAGALDAFYTPIIMKKGRPALKLTVMCAPEVSLKMKEILFRETTTLGVRSYQVLREAADRSWVTVDVDGQQIRVKVGTWHGNVVNMAPEHDDCAAAAKLLGKPLKKIYAQAMAAATQLLH